MRAKSRGGVDNFNNFICEKLQAKFINRHFYLKQWGGRGWGEEEEEEEEGWGDRVTL